MSSDTYLSGHHVDVQTVLDTHVITCEEVYLGAD